MRHQSEVEAAPQDVHGRPGPDIRAGAVDLDVGHGDMMSGGELPDLRQPRSRDVCDSPGR